jgi:hypothetical protein
MAEVKQVQIMVRLDGYQRDYNDPEKGSVTNVGTWNSSYTAIHGADPTGPSPVWFDLTDEQVQQCRDIAAELGTNKVVVEKKTGEYRTVFTAETYMFGQNERYYVVQTELR